MYYEVMLDNGHYPMVYQCSTMHEAYGCLEELASWVPKTGSTWTLLWSSWCG